MHAAWMILEREQVHDRSQVLTWSDAHRLEFGNPFGRQVITVNMDARTVSTGNVLVAGVGLWRLKEDARAGVEVDVPGYPLAAAATGSSIALTSWLGGFACEVQREIFEVADQSNDPLPAFVIFVPVQEPISCLD